MGRSRLQEPFMREVAETFTATKARISRRLAEEPATAPEVIIFEAARAVATTWPRGNLGAGIGCSCSGGK